MVPYADEAKVIASLGIAGDADRIARIHDLNELLSRGLDEQCGRTFGGGTVPPETRETDAYRTELLVLPWGAVSIASIATGGSWDGSTFTGQTALAAADWRPWNVDREGRIWAVKRLNGWWDGQYRITGVWADNPGGTVPNDVVTLVTYLVENHDLLFRTSAAGLEGPDENGIRPLNPWSLQISKLLIAKYRVPRMVV